MIAESRRAKRTGFINPNVFALRNLEYRIRFCHAANVADTVRSVAKGDTLNAYLVRGEYDVVLVSVESGHVLFRALLMRKLEELHLQDVTTFTVDQFLKYRGCLVGEIRRDALDSMYHPETLHYLFNVSKDWDSVPDSPKAALLDANLLMRDAAGMPYEAEVRPDEGVHRRRTLVRLGIPGVVSLESMAQFRRWISNELVTAPIIRSCYSLKSPAACQYLLELTGNPVEIDDFIVQLHETTSTRFAGLHPATRCDEVVRKISDGNLNVLLTMQTRPELVALAEETLIAPVLYSDPQVDTDILHFLERSASIVRSVHAPALQQTCLGMLSAIQLALQLDSYRFLQRAVDRICRQVVDLMVARLSHLFACEATDEGVLAELKHRGLVREHAVTFGNLYPVFVQAVSPRSEDPRSNAAERALEQFNEFHNGLILTKRMDSTDQLATSDRIKAERRFYELVQALPYYFNDVEENT